MDLERNYLAEFFTMWVKVGLIFLIVSTLSDKGIGWITASFIFGLTFFNKVVKFNLFGNHDIVLVFWIVKVLVSALLGMIAFPIVNGYYIFNIIRSYKHKMKNR